VAQARWRLTHLLPADDPEQAVELPASVAVGGVRGDEWFERWQEAKRARRSLVRVNKKRGGAESTAARDRAYWSKWWSPALGSMLPHMVTQRDITAVIDAMEKAGRAPLTMKTHWSVIKAFFGWLFEEDVLTASPIAKASVSADAVLDRVRDIVVPDFRFIDMLSDRLGAGQDRLVFELLLGTGGRRSEVAGLMVGDVDIPEKDCQGSMIPSKVPLSAFEALPSRWPRLAPPNTSLGRRSGTGRLPEPEVDSQRPALIESGYIVRLHCNLARFASGGGGSTPWRETTLTPNSLWLVSSIPAPKRSSPWLASLTSPVPQFFMNYCWKPPRGALTR
jgi:hypothetical protein